VQVVGPRNKAATARGSKEVAERTPISQLFGGALQSTIRSRSQSKPSVTQQPMFAVHLEAHHKTLEDAFAALTRPEQISGRWGGVGGGGGGAAARGGGGIRGVEIHLEAHHTGVEGDKAFEMCVWVVCVWGGGERAGQQPCGTPGGTPREPGGCVCSPHTPQADLRCVL
jgi:hypothetical protein